jgi:hypothetical protein
VKKPTDYNKDRWRANKKKPEYNGFAAEDLAFKTARHVPVKQDRA